MSLRQHEAAATALTDSVLSYLDRDAAPFA